MCRVMVAATRRSVGGNADLVGHTTFAWRKSYNAPRWCFPRTCAAGGGVGLGCRWHGPPPRGYLSATLHPSLGACKMAAFCRLPVRPFSLLRKFRRMFPNVKEKRQRRPSRCVSRAPRAWLPSTALRACGRLEGRRKNTPHFKPVGLSASQT